MSLSEDSAREGDGETEPARLGTGSDKTGSVATGSGEEEAGTGERREKDGGQEGSGDVVIDIAQLLLAEESLENMSHDNHVTEATVAARTWDNHEGRTDHLESDEEGKPPVLEGTLILAPRRGSDTELDLEKREDAYGRRFTASDEMGGVTVPDSTHSTLTEQKRSSPIPISVSTVCDGNTK